MHSFSPVILCGGSGTRLWPLSRALYPKQFVDLGDGHTLFRNTLERINHLSDNAEPVILCTESHRFYVSAALLECEMSGRIILEPEPRNTAPAIAAASFFARERGREIGNDDPILLVLPSDHLLQDKEAFAAGVLKARELAERGLIVTFGITPTGPETGFGYIQQGDAVGSGYRVIRFVEKPDAQNARDMLAEGGFSWNSGIFLFRASTYLNELKKFAPELYGSCEAAWRNNEKNGKFIRLGAKDFLTSPSESIDYAVMEKTNLAAVVPLSTEWSDLGSWEALYQVGSKDENRNVCIGDVICKDSADCYLHGTHRLVTAVGLRNIAVIETQDALLVVHRSRVQDVKEIVGHLNKSHRSESKHHPLVYRPWGSYETLAIASRFQVKRIVVNPGAELSLQMHHHRAEHWVVVSGTAEVTNGESIQMITENQSTYIPLGTMHRLKNPGVIPLVLIEIQSGSYLGEDDIVRFDDIYGRTH